MCSFDVTNLYTNIPLQETIDIILSYLFVSPGTVVLGLSRKLFSDFLQLAILNSFFVFNQKLYRQIEGLGMGLPLAPTLANIFMSHHEQKWLQQCPELFKPVFYRRYVDDTFVLFSDKSHAALFLQYLNNQHNSINFTMDCESDNQLAFLDSCITRVNNCFISDIYRKPTFSGLGLSYFSFVSFRFKINSIQTLLHRAYNVTSNYLCLHKELTFLKHFFTQNGYPLKLIDSQIRKFLNSKFSPATSTVTQRSFFLSLPYFGYQSEKLKTELLTLLQKYFPDIKFIIILVNKNTIGSLFNHKDRLPLFMRSSVVYKYSCPLCGSVYVGSSTRTLKTRAYEHAGKSVRTERHLAHPPFSNIREHSMSCNSSVKLDDFNILDYCNHSSDIRILESLYISKLRPSLNNSLSSHPLYIVK